MKPNFLFAGTHRRAYHADTVDIAFGIYGFRIPGDGGPPTATGMTETPYPGWIAAHPAGAVLYAVNEAAEFEGESGGGVSAFSIDPVTGALSPLNSRRTPAKPCHCEVDSTGRFLLVATYGGGSVHLFPLDPDGRIGPEADGHHHQGSSVHPRRQAQPHAHAVNLDPAGRFVLAPDLGTDRIVVYELDREAARLRPRPDLEVTLPPGSGPRHLSFDPGGRRVYLMNEMTASITVFAYQPAEGRLDAVQTVDCLPEGFAGVRSGAEIRVSPDGRFLYATTRSHGSSGEPPVRGLDDLIWFAIEPEQGWLTLAGRTPSGGEIPRCFIFDEGGTRLLVGHQASGTVVTFDLDPLTGTPRATGETLAVPVPVCLCQMPRT